MADITVVLATHNRLQYVREAVESVLSQAGVTCELIIVDDASSDGTFETLQRQYGLDRRVNLLSNGRNLGPSGALQRGVDLATSPLVTFLGDDDSFLPGSLWAAVELMSERPNVGFAWFGVEQYAESFLPENLTWSGVKMVPLRDDPKQRELAWAHTNPGSGHLLVVRRQCFDEVGGYDSQFLAAGDTDLLLRLMRRYDYTSDPRPAVRVRLHESGQTIGNAQLRAESMELLLTKHKREFQEVPVAYALWLKKAGVWMYRAGARWKARRRFVTSIRLAPTSREVWKSWAALEWNRLRQWSGRLS